jgi:hypothetical protein
MVSPNTVTMDSVPRRRSKRGATHIDERSEGKPSNKEKKLVEDIRDDKLDSSLFTWAIVSDEEQSVSHTNGDTIKLKLKNKRRPPTANTVKKNNELLKALRNGGNVVQSKKVF